MYGIDDSGPDEGAWLWGGRLEGGVIQCWAHGLRFDLASGYLLNSKALSVASYPVEQEGGQVYLVLAAEESEQ